MALADFQNDKPEDALTKLETILSATPNHAFAWFLFAVINMQKRQTDTAISGFKNALKHQPIYPEAANNLGVALESLGKIEEAELTYKKAIKQKKGYANAHYNLANIKKENDDFSSAIEHYTLAIKYKPDYINALNNLALLHQQNLFFIKSEALLLQALALSKDDIEIKNNLGQNYYNQFEYSKAWALFDSILKENPRYESTLLNTGLLMKAMGRIDEAREYYHRISTNGPFHTQAMNNLAHLELSLSNFEKGWDYYRFRPSTRSSELTFLEKIPKDISEKSVLLLKDQGIGDEIFFARFIPFLTKYNIKLSYYTDERLSSFWERTFSGVSIITTYEHADFDYVISVGDLPHLLYQDGYKETPPSLSFTPLPSALENIKNQLPNNGKKNVCVTWEAGVADKNFLYKKVPIHLLGKKLSHEDVNIIIIQRNPKSKDIKLLEKSLGRKAFNFSFLNNNLEEMLALLSIIDDYHCVSNTNVHLMAALNKSSHIYVPHPPDWRWLNDENNTPWFPSNKIYRQTDNGSWS